MRKAVRDSGMLDICWSRARHHHIDDQLGDYHFIISYLKPCEILHT
jgi:hypothetical protein